LLQAKPSPILRRTRQPPCHHADMPPPFRSMEIQGGQDLRSKVCGPRPAVLLTSNPYLFPGEPKVLRAPSWPPRPFEPARGPWLLGKSGVLQLLAVCFAESSLIAAAPMLVLLEMKKPPKDHSWLGSSTVQTKSKQGYPSANSATRSSPQALARRWRFFACRPSWQQSLGWRTTSTGRGVDAQRLTRVTTSG
jgi:hypothetical protein